MTYSMTGFGKAQFTLEEKSFTVEIKCLNSKQQDVSVRMPSKYKSKELIIRNLLIDGLKRGKIELSVYIDSGSEQRVQSINTAVFKAYAQQITSLTNQDLSPDLTAVILKMPEVFSVEKEELNDEEWLLLEKTIFEAVEQVKEFRKIEGENLQKDLLQRIVNINKGLTTIIERDVIRIQKVKNRLNSSLEEIQEKLVDKNRFEQELIYYLEKLDITEEKVRLKSHTDYFLDTLEQNEEKGKKLGFVSQEIGREINTIGSKANDSEMQQTVVGMKDELEKIKEQLLNIL